MILNGITVEPGNESVMSGNAYFFSAYALSSTSYVYNGAGGQAASDGWIPISGAGARTIQYNVASPTGTVTLSLYGKVGKGTAETEIATITTAAATTGFINIAEDISEMRVGVKISAGAATVSVTGKFKGMQFSI